MTTYVGKDGVIKTGSTPTLVAEVTGFTVREEHTPVNDSELTDTWDTIKPGTQTWSADVEAHYDDTDSAGQASWVIGTEVDVEFYPAGDTSSLPLLTGSAIITGVEQVNARDATVTASFSMAGNGALTRGTVGP